MAKHTCTTKKGAGKKKQNNDDSTIQLCFPDCKLSHNKTDSMIQCHLCQVWAHLQCINEKDDDIIGLWCCNTCRKLPEKTAMLCDKIDDLQRDMAILLNLARSLSVNTSVPVPVKPARPDATTLCDNKQDSNDKALSIIQQCITQGEQNMNTTTSSQPSTALNQTEHNNHSTNTTPKGSIDQSKPAVTEPCRLKAAGPSKPVHEVFIGGLQYNTTEDDVSAYLMDINVECVRNVRKLSLSDKQNASFHVSISATSIKDTVYGGSKFPPGVIVKPYRSYLRNVKSKSREHTNKPDDKPAMEAARTTHVYQQRGSAPNRRMSYRNVTRPRYDINRDYRTYNDTSRDYTRPNHAPRHTVYNHQQHMVNTENNYVRSQTNDTTDVHVPPHRFSTTIPQNMNYNAPHYVNPAPEHLSPHNGHLTQHVGQTFNVNHNLLNKQSSTNCRTNPSLPQYSTHMRNTYPTSATSTYMTGQRSY